MLLEGIDTWSVENPEEPSQDLHVGRVRLLESSYHDIIYDILWWLECLILNKVHSERYRRHLGIDNLRLYRLGPILIISRWGGYPSKYPVVGSTYGDLEVMAVHLSSWRCAVVNCMDTKYESCMLLMQGMAWVHGDCYFESLLNIGKITRTITTGVDMIPPPDVGMYQKNHPNDNDGGRNDTVAGWAVLGSTPWW